MATIEDDGLGDDLAEQTVPIAGVNSYSARQREAIQAGFSLSVLCEIFGKDKRDGRARLKDLQPSGYRAGFPVYDLKEAARYLVDPVVDVEEFIKKLRPQDLPMALQSEFWKAQNARLKFEEDTGNLWRTEKVVAVLADVFRTIRQTVSLFSEAIERQTDLTEKQRQLIIQLTDGLLNDIGDALAKNFEGYDGSQDHIDIILENGVKLDQEPEDDGL